MSEWASSSPGAEKLKSSPLLSSRRQTKVEECLITLLLSDARPLRTSPPQSQKSKCTSRHHFYATSTLESADAQLAITLPVLNVRTVKLVALQNPLAQFGARLDHGEAGTFDSLGGASIMPLLLPDGTTVERATLSLAGAISGRCI